MHAGSSILLLVVLLLAPVSVRSDEILHTFARRELAGKVDCERLKTALDGQPQIWIDGTASGGWGVRALWRVSQPIQRLWATFVDRDHFDQQASAVLYAATVSTTPQWFDTVMLLDPPVPMMSDRVQVLRSVIDAGPFADDQGRVWRYRWSLSPRFDTMVQTALRRPDAREWRSDLREAERVEKNSTVLTLIALGRDDTLIVATAESDPGGRVPEGLVRRFADNSLRSSLDELMLWARQQADRHFREAHPAIPGPDGAWYEPLTFMERFRWADAAGTTGQAVRDQLIRGCRE